MIRVAITAANGRMGKSLVQVLHSSQNCGLQLAGAVHRQGSSYAGQDVGQLAGIGNIGVQVQNTLGDAIAYSNFDIVIDFSLVEPTLQHLEFCLEKGKAMVIGTTGFNEQQKKQINSASRHIPIVFAPNMSVGVNLSFHLLQIAARVMGEEADIEISETHHRDKVDAPSGTAIRMGEVIAEQLGRNLEDVAVYGRQGVTGAREQQTIGFATRRAGDVVGDHTVLFANQGERLEISHKASSRLTFARGAVQAARWLSAQGNGLYDMQDVLGF